MNVFLTRTISVLCIGMLLLNCACKKDAEVQNDCFDESADQLGAQTKEFIISDSVSTSITIYSAMTPVNYAYCTYPSASLNVEEQVCQPNEDTVYNDVSAGLNDIFPVDYDFTVFEDNGFITQLTIHDENLVTDYYWNSWDQFPKGSYGSYGASFDGLTPTLVSGSQYEQKQFPTGMYQYSFQIYDLIADRTSLSASELSERLDEIDEYSFVWFMNFFENNQPVDSMVGKFCIIRQQLDCDLSFLDVQDSGDGLLE